MKERKVRRKQKHKNKTPCPVQPILTIKTPVLPQRWPPLDLTACREGKGLTLASFSGINRFGKVPIKRFDEKIWLNTVKVFFM